LTGLRLSRTLAAEGDDGTVPPKYIGLMTSASAAGTPVAVKGDGVGTAVVVGAATAFLTTLGADEHPLSAMAPARTEASPTMRAGRDEDRGKGSMVPPYGVTTLLSRTRVGPRAVG
jgi:hypothetical protein